MNMSACGVMRQLKGPAFAWGLMVAVMLGLSTPVGGAQEGEYFREDQNIPAAERAPGQIGGLLFWLRSEAGVTVDANGAVQAWVDPTKPGCAFAALANAAIPVRRVEHVLGGKPALAFAAAQNRAGGLRSGPVAIDPAKGLTLFVLARVTAPDNGGLLGYGHTYKTVGSLAIGLSGLASYKRVVPQAHTGDGSPVLESSAGNVFGKGFVLFATRFAPATGEQTLYENGFEVGRARRTEPLAAAHPFAVGVTAGGQWSFSGEILTALAYNRALTDDELRSVRRALFAEYGLGGSAVSAMAPLLPYAYYPSRNQMEVAIELSPELLAKARGGDAATPAPKEIRVRVLDIKSGNEVAVGTVPLDGQARGQAVFSVPDLPAGEYAVEYLIGKHLERSPKTFKRFHFPFEKTAFGQSHEVYPPFTPVQVAGRKVSVVDRTYTVNAQGLFDSVVSQGRELLAASMRLVAETADGKRIDWKTSWLSSGVAGKVLYPDEAVFVCETRSEISNLKSQITIQEDGCAKVEMTLTPDPRNLNPPPSTPRPPPVVLSRLWLEIPLKDAEVPLFHYSADNGMRFNYAGRTPRGGKIEWYSEAWDGWVPLRWRVAEPGPDDGVIWTSADTRQHGNTERWDHRPFVPYLWLGAEERGLAFFMENEKGFTTDYRTPLQKVIRQGNQVIIRVEIFQQPVALTAPRTITFGLMASPGKPMEKTFRARPFASGVGPVSCWGGWQCSSKYPDNRDWSIVDKIQEIRRRGKMTKEDDAWFDAKSAEVTARWPDRHLHHDPKSQSWLWLTKHFAQRAAEQGAPHSGIYFEEHATDPLLPEWEVFQDEWASAEFNRFRDKPANWGVFSPSYHNFVLYMANEWMQRGVSLYFDNTNPKRCYSERFGPAYRTPAGSLVYGISLFAQREYYRRICKLRSAWNQRGGEYPIDFTLHITNTQTLPFNTWATATLDLEQRAYTEDPEKVPAEVETGKKGEASKAKPQGYQLPWSPDYTRTVTFGRQVGAIPLGLDFVSGHGRHESNDYTPEMMLRDWAMRRIHDIRPGVMYTKSAAQAREFEKTLLEFGYGKPEQVEHHNYWGEKPFVTISDDRIKWLALTRCQLSGVRCQEAKTAAGPVLKPETRNPKPPSSPPTPLPEPRTLNPDTFTGLHLLQSYSRTDAVTVTVAFPGAATLTDVQTNECIAAPGGKALIAMPANFATRLFRVGCTPDPNSRSN